MQRWRRRQGSPVEHLCGDVAAAIRPLLLHLAFQPVLVITLQAGMGGAGSRRMAGGGEREGAGRGGREGRWGQGSKGQSRRRQPALAQPASPAKGSRPRPTCPDTVSSAANRRLRLTKESWDRSRTTRSAAPSSYTGCRPASATHFMPTCGSRRQRGGERAGACGGGCGFEPMRAGRQGPRQLLCLRPGRQGPGTTPHVLHHGAQQPQPAAAAAAAGSGTSWAASMLRLELPITTQRSGGRCIFCAAYR